MGQAYTQTFDVEHMPAMIQIGRATETGVRELRFDVSAWLRRWPKMNIEILPTAPGTAMKYPVAVRMDGTAAVWAISDSDTAQAGTGSVEIVGRCEGKQVVSASAAVVVLARTPGTDGEAPDYARPWLDEVLDAAERVESAAEASAHPPVIGDGGTWLLWDMETGAYVDSGFMARGATGAQGEQGPQGERGEQGIPGEKGDTGPKGDTGEPGLQGVQGATGPQGEQGERGPQGIQGEKGDTGPQGDTGPAGPQGPAGEKGPKGDKGDTGPQGPQGEPGKDGAMYELPTASETVKGGVMIGTGLQMDGETLNVATDDTLTKMGEAADSAAVGKAIRQLAERNPHIYGVRWDRTNAKMTRLFEAAGITTDVSNFAHKGSINTNYNNPFDNIYPWNQFKACNVDLNKYRSLSPGTDIREAVTAWYGEPGFAQDGSNSFVGAYRPRYWYTAYEDADGSVVFAVATEEMAGWRESPPYIRGMGSAVDAGDNLLTCHSGQPLTNVAMSTLHARARSSGFTIEDIYSYSAELTAFVVEYATMDAQSAIGNGVSSGHRQNEADRPLIAETGATRVVLPSAFAPYAFEGATLDFGATNGGVVLANRRMCTGYEEYADNPDYISVSFDQPLDVTTDMFVSAHGAVNGMSLGSESGYIGANGRANAFYRGAVMHANRWRYILGVYRQTGTSAIWMCNAPEACDAYDALNTSVHVDTGCVFPTKEDGATKEGYVKDLHIIPGMGALPFCRDSGGNSSNPVGDFFYAPAATTGNTVLLAGGYASSGLGAGPFCGYWSASAGTSGWGSAVSPVLKRP